MKRLIPIYFLLLLLSACHAPASNLATRTNGDSHSLAVERNATSTPLPLTLSPSSQIPTQDVLAPSKTAINPPGSTIKPSSTRTPTPIPLPTFTAEERDELLTDWFTNPPCEFPCWWDLVPGQSNRFEVEAFLHRLSAGFDNREFFQEVEFVDVGENDGRLSIFFQYDEGFRKRAPLQVIDIRINETSNYPAGWILSHYGEPDELLIRALLFLPSGDSIFDFVLEYWQLGFAIQYSTIVSFEQSSEWTTDAVACTQFPGPVRIVVWNSGQSDRELSESAMDFGFGYLSIEQASAMTITHFYESYSGKPESICLETPIDIWLSEEG